ncbi:hypothetical protein Pa4123_63770 [Phytohabitans aurantiacus]|uniref:Uncharacterized protein n=1 Tax=Phytohabitans aurantiacus TaxID=3016789 RepID=A0ABQ5R6C1_9ACTN|nr:hypothetical protein Pa4123_63770 [Phytohabitans aurantiacus]
MHSPLIGGERARGATARARARRARADRAQRRRRGVVKSDLTDPVCDGADLIRCVLRLAVGLGGDTADR